MGRKNSRGGGGQQEIFALRAKLLPPSDQNPVYAPVLMSYVLCLMSYFTVANDYKAINDFMVVNDFTV